MYIYVYVCIYVCVHIYSNMYIYSNDFSPMNSANQNFICMVSLELTAYFLTFNNAGASSQNLRKFIER
jgi:hypothetical protein